MNKLKREDLWPHWYAHATPPTMFKVMGKFLTGNLWNKMIFGNPMTKAKYEFQYKLKQLV